MNNIKQPNPLSFVYLWFFFLLQILLYTAIVFSSGTLIFRHTLDDKNIDISIVVLTYKNFEALAELLPSIDKQRPGNFEIIIVDNGCLLETQQVIERASVPYKYLPLCDNPGYAVGNNAGVALAASSSRWVLFLNDDVVLSDEDFIQNMVHLGDAQNNAVAVGCKLLTAAGDEIIEAGSIIWSNGGATGFGRGRRDIEAPDLSYPKPVDYVSGACLMIDKLVFTNRGGFDKNFPNYYEDTDLQMYIQHELGKEVWLQPLAVARHDEHGSFGQKDSVTLMQKASKTFITKWQAIILEHHIHAPFTLTKYEQDVEHLRASDVRARNPTKANILYLDTLIPNKTKGSGYGRAFDNIAMIATLGHRVTVVSQVPATSEWCNAICRSEIVSLGVELVTSSWESLVDSRIGFYDIVIVSRPTTFEATYAKLCDFMTKSTFVLVYDCEALWYRRDEKLFTIEKEGTIHFPSSREFTTSTMDLLVMGQRNVEVSLLSMADEIVPVSEAEAKIISKIYPQSRVTVVGHVMGLDRITKSTFHERSGILFLASFGGDMYYNGDAIWYFITAIYPLVLKESPSPINLTIAGREIPDLLRTYVQKTDFYQFVTFIESPIITDNLFDQARIFIAPHLYGAGIQYKVSEALSVGLPVVMSNETAEGFGLPFANEDISCIGYNTESFKNCIIIVHSNELIW
eukprot:CAMPEP_0198285732 /NCGR_PEP_ID=MMETSP1449-20131203/4967_1 /TAXON_ID=420275 /ORGANISM="Attheya septentrionalis, Strain CCMP2084" /LENGTH=684 /DNA_ID=CAMNT_0043983265 /DNA_START=220 /DNA_END=2271 /DNA_ORIENTATION=+